MTKKFIILFFFYINIGLTSFYGQSNPLTADINNATHAQNCEDGSIDLTITGGFAPYDVIWNF